MDKQVLLEMARKEWYLGALCLLFIGLGAYKFFTGAEEPAQVKGSAVEIKHYVQSGGTVSVEQPKAITPEDRARTTIADHERRLAEEDLTPDEAATLMDAIGNLRVQRLMEYKEAAEEYELLLTMYPDWSGAGRVYRNLAMCYQRMNDAAQEQQVYLRMRDVFPPDSPEYKTATEELDL